MTPPTSPRPHVSTSARPHVSRSARPHVRTSAHFLSNILAVAYKEATALRHDQAVIAAVLVQPVMMLLLFGFALSNKPANVPWAVLDQSRSAPSRRFVAEVEATGYFLPPRAAVSYDAGHALLERGTVVALVVIPASFRRDLERGRPQVQVLLDGTDPLTAARVGGYISQVAAAFEPGNGPAGSGARPAALDLRQRFRFNPTLRDRDFFLATMAGMLLTNICLSISSLGLVGERESGTYEHILSSPTTPIEIVIGKLLPYVGVSYGLLFVATVAAGLVFGIWPQGSGIALLAVTLPFVLASLAFGVFVSAIAHTSAQAVFISVFFILPSFVLSGVMFPYQLMPPGVREVGYLLPLRWYQIAQRRIVERGAGLADVAVPMLALTVFFLAVLLLIRWRMKPRLG